jgi:hypothetical protein
MVLNNTSRARRTSDGAPGPIDKPEETDASVEALAASVKRKPAPRLKVSYKGKAARVSFDDPSQLGGLARFMLALGTTDPDFASGLIRQLANISSPGSNIDEDALNFVTSIVKGMGPKDQVEAILAVQMAAIHLATVTFSRRLAHVENIPQQDSAERALNKLARTFVSQV